MGLEFDDDIDIKRTKKRTNHEVVIIFHNYKAMVERGLSGGGETRPSGRNLADVE